MPVKPPSILMIRPPDETDLDRARVLWIRPRLLDFGQRFGGARGMYRVMAPAVYRFYRGSVPPALGDTPYATSASLPSQPTNTFANGTWYLSVSYFNGVLDSGFLPIGGHGETYLKLVLSGGAQSPAIPSGPENARLEVRAAGVVRIVAIYSSIADRANAAAEWAIAYTVDGSTPAVATPTITRPMSAGPISILVYDLPAQSAGTTVKVQLQTRRAGTIYSAASAVLSAVAVTAGPVGPLGGGEF